MQRAVDSYIRLFMNQFQDLKATFVRVCLYWLFIRNMICFVMLFAGDVYWLLTLASNCIIMMVCIVTMLCFACAVWCRSMYLVNAWKHHCIFIYLCMFWKIYIMFFACSHTLLFLCCVCLSCIVGHAAGRCSACDWVSLFHGAALCRPAFCWLVLQSLMWPSACFQRHVFCATDGRLIRIAISTQLGHVHQELSWAAICLQWSWSRVQPVHMSWFWCVFAALARRLTRAHLRDNAVQHDCWEAQTFCLGFATCRWQHQPCWFIDKPSFLQVSEYRIAARKYNVNAGVKLWTVTIFKRNVLRQPHKAWTFRRANCDFVARINDV